MHDGTMVTGSADRTLRVWDTNTGVALLQICITHNEKYFINSMKSTGSEVYVGLSDDGDEHGKVLCVDVKSGKIEDVVAEDLAGYVHVAMSSSPGSSIRFFE